MWKNAIPKAAITFALAVGFGHKAAAQVEYEDHAMKKDSAKAWQQKEKQGQVYVVSHLFASQHYGPRQSPGTVVHGKKIPGKISGGVYYGVTDEGDTLEIDTRPLGSGMQPLTGNEIGSYPDDQDSKKLHTMFAFGQNGKDAIDLQLSGGVQHNGAKGGVYYLVYGSMHQDFIRHDIGAEVKTIAPPARKLTR